MLGLEGRARAGERERWGRVLLRKERRRDCVKAASMCVDAFAEMTE